METFEQYVPILLFVLVATGFALFTLIVSALVSSSKYNKDTHETYERGIEPETPARDT